MKIRNATKQGWINVPVGGCFSIAFPESELRRGRVIEDGKVTPTVDTSDNIGLLVTEDGKKVRVRKLTPKECFKLQGFPDEYFERAAEVNSDSQLYKQIGNSVTVDVIYEIARRFK